MPKTNILNLVKARELSEVETRGGHSQSNATGVEAFPLLYLVSQRGLGGFPHE